MTNTGDTGDTGDSTFYSGVVNSNSLTTPAWPVPCGSDAKFLCSTAGLEPPVLADNAPVAAAEPDENPEHAEKDVSVGAGAVIRQGLLPDPLSHDDWKADPSALIRLYFVFPEQFKEIVRTGVRDLNGKKEGFLDGMPVG